MQEIANGLIHAGPPTNAKTCFATGRVGMRWLLAVALCAAMAVSAIAQDDKPPRKFTFGLMGVAMRADLTVYQGGARDADGNIVIKEHDRLQKWNGKDLKSLDDFCRALYATKPGELVEVEISSPGDGENRLVSTVKVKLGDPKAAYKELYTRIDKRKRTHDWRKQPLVTTGGPLREKLQPMLKEHKLEQPWDNLIAAHQRELDLWDSYENLSSTDLLLGDPLAAHQWIFSLGRDFDQAGKQRDPESSLRRCLLHLLDKDSAPAERWADPRLPDQPANKEDGLKWWREVAEFVLRYAVPWKIDPATPADDWAKTIELVREFEFAWRGTEGFEKSAQTVDHIRAQELDVAGVLVALPWMLSTCQRMAQGYWDSHQRKEVPAAPADLDLAAFVKGEAVCFESGFGLVAIGGTGPNVWTGGAGAPALIFELGGNDEYIDCATTTGGTRQVSIVIDLGGNDHYRSTGKWGVACGMLGTAIIDDREGNDTYECGDWGIGAAFGGVGLLIDGKGNDRYLGGTNSIGCAAYGVGGVADLEGNDIYDSHAMSVGVGQPGGVGFVFDHSGDDRYRCTGETPSSYGTQGEWFGGGIGCGFGWRTLACGGVGLVVDASGNDIYDAGEFGLACGYFMAVGAVRDMEGDDIYHSSRYGLAAAAHAAVGVFMDDKGNDVYEGKTAASIGGVWDIATGYFYDGAGNDVYRCDGLGLGAAAQNAFGIFWDAGGDDVYRSGSGDFQHGARTIGEVGGFEYAGGRLARNFGVFIDGGGTDSYPRDNRKNGSTVVENEYAIFWDE